MMAYALEDEFGDIIKKARRGLDLGLDQLSDATQIPNPDLSKMEDYLLKPTVDQVSTLANQLDLDADKLLRIAEESWTPAPVPANYDPALEIVTISENVGGWPVHAYLLVCKETHQMAIIDTAAHPQTVIRKANAQAVPVVAILLTHAHGDHANGLPEIQQAFEAPTYIHQHEPKPKSATPLQLVEHGDEIQVGALQVLVLDTPGHTPGGCAFYTRNTVIVGDAIFAGSVGNASVSYEGLLSSVRQNVLTLPDQTYLFPGHGPATTVAEEKAHNPFF